MNENDTSRNLTNAANALSAAADALLEMAKSLDKDKNEIYDLKNRVQRNEEFRKELASMIQKYID